MDKALRNTFIGILATVIVTFVGAWIQLNSRISVLEVQVDNDHRLFMANQDKTDKNMEKLMDKVNDIQMKVTHLSATQKGGKKYEDD